LSSTASTTGRPFAGRDGGAGFGAALRRLDGAFGDQRRQRLRQHPVDRPFQLARAELAAGAPFEQQRARSRRHFDLERPVPEPGVHVPLQLGDVVIEDLG
jgi:hypothetical protein